MDFAEYGPITVSVALGLAIPCLLLAVEWHLKKPKYRVVKVGDNYYAERRECHILAIYWIRIPPYMNFTSAVEAEASAVAHYNAELEKRKKADPPKPAVIKYINMGQ